jgi:hypothetical protein
VSSERIDFDKPVTIKTDDFITFGRAFRIEGGEVFYFRCDKQLHMREEVFLKVELPRAEVPLSCYVRIEKAGNAGDGLRGYVGRLCSIAAADAKRFDHWLRYMSGGGSSLNPDLVVEEEGESFDKRMNSATKVQVRSELRRLDEALGTSRRSKDPFGFARTDKTRAPVDTAALMQALSTVDRGTGRRVVRKRRVTRRVRKSSNTALDIDTLQLEQLLPPLGEGEGVDGIDYDELLEEAEHDNALDVLLDEAVGAEEEVVSPTAQELVDDEDSWGDEDTASEDDGDVVVAMADDEVRVRWLTREALERDFLSHLKRKLLRVPGSAPSKTPNVRLVLPDGQILALRSRLTSQGSDHFELQLDLKLATKGKIKRAAMPPQA